jgi:hypothetical protein
MVSADDDPMPLALKAGVDLFLTSANLVQIGVPIAEFLHKHGLVDRTET